MKFRNCKILVVTIALLLLAVACSSDPQPPPPQPGQPQTGQTGGTQPGGQPANPGQPAGGTDKPAEPVTKEKAASLYAGRCVACHGEDGKGKKEVAPKVPDLTSKEFHSTKTDADLANSITNGIGTGKGAMPRWKNLLSPQEIEALVAYVRSLQK